MQSALAMIMAGSNGKKLGILCHHRSKPALPFAGNTHAIDFALSNCVHSEINNILVLTDYHRSNLANYIMRWAMVNNQSGRINIDTAKRPHLGSAHVVYKSLDYLSDSDSDLVLILAGDHIYKMDYRKVLEYHTRIGADATVVVAQVPIEDAERFGIVTLDADSRIVDFDEKPDFPRNNLASMGIYVFNKNVLIERIMEDAKLTSSPHDFGHAILPKMVKQDRVFAFRYDGYWRDVATPQAYYETNMELLQPGLSFELNGIPPVLTDTSPLEFISRSQQGIVENSLVSPGCTIKGHVENSIILPGVWICEEAEVKNSIIMSNTFVGFHSVIDHCIVDERVNIGKLSYLGFGGIMYSRTNGLTLIGENVTVPSHTAIGRNCKIFPHVSPEDFSGNLVPSNSILSPRQLPGALRVEDKEDLIYAGQGIRTT